MVVHGFGGERFRIDGELCPGRLRPTAIPAREDPGESSHEDLRATPSASPAATAKSSIHVIDSLPILSLHNARATLGEPTAVTPQTGTSRIPLASL